MLVEEEESGSKLYVVNKTNSLTQALSLIETILNETQALSKPRRRFMLWMFSVWLGLPVRRTMLNLARFGPYCEKSIRLHMARGFSFAEFGRLLIDKHCGAKRICAFDPSHLAKAGRHTYGVDYWWCGTLNKAVRGLELGVLGVIDVAARSAFSLQATQTPAISTLRAQGKNLMAHYVGLLEEQSQRLKQLRVTYITADAYFAKTSFVDAIVEMKFHVVTRMRPDANLNYLYHGPRNPKGRPKQYAGKVDCQRIDKRRLRLFRQDEHCSYYSGVGWAVGFKRLVRIVYIQQNKSKNQKHRILMSTDTELAAEKIVEYYQLRFQIEFLIRDAKSYAGLEECQARDEEKLFFHFNMALASVSWAKAAFWLSIPQPQRGAFSLRNIKLLFTGQMWTDRVFQNLGLDLSLIKLQQAYQRCLDMEKLTV